MSENWDAEDFEFGIDSTLLAFGTQRISAKDARALIIAQLNATTPLEVPGSSSLIVMPEMPELPTWGGIRRDLGAPPITGDMAVPGVTEPLALSEDHKRAAEELARLIVRALPDEALFVEVIRNLDLRPYLDKIASDPERTLGGTAAGIDPVAVSELRQDYENRSVNAWVESGLDPKGINPPASASVSPLSRRSRRTLQASSRRPTRACRVSVT